MVYLFIFFVVLIVGLIIVKAVRKRKLPNNHYTPYDDITIGKSDRDNI
ncbi:hypothetical protein ABEP00_06945 [Heyndrickxia sporothermodurans]